MHSQLFDNLTDNFNSGVDDEQKLLEQRLLEQQRQSEEDSRWLAREEVLWTTLLDHPSSSSVETVIKLQLTFSILVETSVDRNEW